MCLFLAVVEHVTVYYIHRDLCREIKTMNNMNELKQSDDRQAAPVDLLVGASNSIIATKNVTIVPSYNSITLTWKIEIEDNSTLAKQRTSMISVIRQISVRKFGSNNATQLFVLEDFNKTALMTGNIESESAR